jgi:hypothetical protein
VVVLIISIKNEYVNKRVRRAARATRVRRIRCACLAVSKLFIY